MRKCKKINSNETYYYKLGKCPITDHVNCQVYELYLTNESQNTAWTTIVDIDEFDESYVDIKIERKNKLLKINENL